MLAAYRSRTFKVTRGSVQPPTSSSRLKLNSTPILHHHRRPRLSFFISRSEMCVSFPLCVKLQLRGQSDRDPHVRPDEWKDNSPRSSLSSDCIPCLPRNLPPPAHSCCIGSMVTALGDPRRSTRADELLFMMSWSDTNDRMYNV